MSGSGNGNSEVASLVLVDELQHSAEATDHSGGGTRSARGCRECQGDGGATNDASGESRRLALRR
jgi:hypothetical protein